MPIDLGILDFKNTINKYLSIIPTHFFGYRDEPIPHIVQMGVYGRAYFDSNQIRPFLMQQFGNVRFVWNYFRNLLLAQYKARRAYCKKHHINFSKMSKKERSKAYGKLPMILRTPQSSSALVAELDKILTRLKKSSSYFWLKKSDSTTLQITIKRLVKTIKNAKSGKNGFPKSMKRSWTQSYSTKSSSIKSSKFFAKRISYSTYKIKLPKLKKTVEVHFNRDVASLADKINILTVTMKSTGKFKISLNIDTQKMFLDMTGRAVGIDVNLHPWLVLSTGQKYKNKHYYKYYNHKLTFWIRRRERRQRKAQKEIAHNRRLVTNPRSYVGNLKLFYFQFHNYMKAKNLSAKYYKKIADCTMDRVQKVTTSLVKRFDIICIEDIKISQLTHNHKLARAIEHACWYEFRRILAYKCSWYGKKLVLVDKNNTTRCCWYCHTNNGKKVAQLGVGYWECKNSNCPFSRRGHGHDRDINAAINILLLGLGILKKESLQPNKHIRRDLISRQCCLLTGQRLGTSRKPTTFFSLMRVPSKIG